MIQFPIPGESALSAKSRGRSNDYLLTIPADRVDHRARNPLWCDRTCQKWGTTSVYREHTDIAHVHWTEHGDTDPGAFEFLRSELVHSIGPALLAAYAASNGTPFFPASDEIVTMCPLPQASIDGSTSRARSSGATRFVSTTHSMSSKDRSSKRM